MKTLVVLEYPMPYTKFQGHQLKKKISEVFHHIWAWSCDFEHLKKKTRASARHFLMYKNNLSLTMIKGKINGP